MPYCPLCNVEVSEANLASHRVDETHVQRYLDSLQVPTIVSYPAYIEKSAFGYTCKWCDKQLLSEDHANMHLQGKDHTRRCLNSDISPYGSETHYQEVAEYVRRYGHDSYARLAHWPECIVSTPDGMFWECVACGGKRKFQTQKIVNDHLKEEDHLKRLERFSAGAASDQTSVAGTSNKVSAWPSCIEEFTQDTCEFWRCVLCDKKFNSPDTVDLHLKHPRHINKVAQEAIGGESTAAVMRRKRKEWTRSPSLQDEERRTTLGASSSNFPCFECMQLFYSPRAFRDHVNGLLHLSAIAHPICRFRRCSSMGPPPQPHPLRKAPVVRGPAEEEITEKDGGYIANMTPEEIAALEERKAKIAARIVLKRQEAEAAKAVAEKAEKAEENRRRKAYVKGNKMCQSNRIYEDDQGWYICEVCDKKFVDVEIAADHCKTAKHLSNLEWYSSHPLPSEEHESKYLDQLPSYVKWDEPSQFYVCELCNSKAACMQVMESHLEGQNHKKKIAWQQYLKDTALAVAMGMGSAGTKALPPQAAVPSSVATSVVASSIPPSTPSLPPYCEYDKLDQMFVCRWCDKRAADIGMLEIHLGSKEHTKKATNVGIEPWGHPNHLAQATEYTQEYGFDLWARRNHWPEFIADDGQVWKCEICNKKYVTPSAVNDHLLGHGNIVPKRRQPPAAVIPLTVAPSRIPPQLSVVSPHTCTLCMLDFNSAQELKVHETSDKLHLAVIRRVTGPPINKTLTNTVSYDGFWKKEAFASNDDELDI